VLKISQDALATT